MVRLLIIFILLTVFNGYSQTTRIIPVENIPDAPASYITFMYETLVPYFDNQNLNDDIIESGKRDIDKFFWQNEKSKPYLVFFSSLHTKAMVEEQTEKLLKKWDFENNYPYCYLIILSPNSYRLVTGKYLSISETNKKLMDIYIQKATKYEYDKDKILELIFNLGIIRFDIKVHDITKDYLAQWDKRHFFNYNKTISQKQERYINKLLEDAYQKNNLCFWIILDGKSEEIAIKLAQKADFNTRSRQCIIMINTDNSDVPLLVVLTRDLQNKWSNITYEHVKEIAYFYRNKGWYYDLVKETFLMIKDELLYQNIAIRKQEEQARDAEMVVQNKMYSSTIKMHKALFWTVTMGWLILLVISKRYIEKIYAGEPAKKIRDMKVVLGIGYAIFVLLTGIWIVSSTPLFYVSSHFPKILSNTFLWMLLYFAVLLFLYSKKIIEKSVSVKVLLVVTLILYFFFVDIHYATATQGEWLAENSDTDFFNLVFLIPLGTFVVNRFAKKRNMDNAIQKMVASYSKGASLRKGFGQRTYVYKHMRN